MNFKYLYKSVIVFSVLFFLFSCEKESFDTKTELKVYHRQVSSNQAKAFTNMLSNSLFTNEEGGAKLKNAGTRRYSTNKATVYPFTGSQYKWGQGTGYNFNAPVSVALAGCPAVAVGLLCVHHWYPYQFG